MSNTVIKVENLSKQYRLGNVGTGTLSHDMKRWWHKVRGKEDPFLKIGEANDRASKGISEYVWALQDINFEVKAGEVLGIIGRNGAGKSTLLKILSKTTAPTTGSIKIKGRIASLLEVGTGFHPELTGRENIFLNGAILGMTKKEIKSKFDEIVDFSGVERYIDTPVKRYSSGMYVRLAFAVAAHLEPEILIVDEVLAVGDAEFQKKCLGKMKDVSVNDGKTVLFVSHDLKAIRTLCDEVIVLKNGTASKTLSADIGLSLYTMIQDVDNKKYPIMFEEFQLNSFRIFQNGHEVSELIGDYDIVVKLNVFVFKLLLNFRLGIKIFNNTSELILMSLIGDWDTKYNNLEKGSYNFTLTIPSKYFNKGSLTFKVHASVTPVKDFQIEDGTIKHFQITSPSTFNLGFPNENAFGQFILDEKWNISND